MRILAGQTVLRTGASGGLGTFMAQAFAGREVKLALVAHPLPARLQWHRAGVKGDRLAVAGLDRDLAISRRFARTQGRTRHGPERGRESSELGQGRLVRAQAEEVFSMVVERGDLPLAVKEDHSRGEAIMQHLGETQACRDSFDSVRPGQRGTVWLGRGTASGEPFRRAATVAVRTGHSRGAVPRNGKR